MDKASTVFFAFTLVCITGLTALGQTALSQARGRSSWSPLAVTSGSPCAFHSERSACITSTRAARAAGSHDATTAAASSTKAERITGKAPGIFTSGK